MEIQNMSLSPLTQVEMQEVEGGFVPLLVVCFAAGLAIGLALT